MILAIRSKAVRLVEIAAARFEIPSTREYQDGCLTTSLRFLYKSNNDRLVELFGNGRNNSAPSESEVGTAVTTITGAV